MSGPPVPGKSLPDKGRPLVVAHRISQFLQSHGIVAARLPKNGLTEFVVVGVSILELLRRLQILTLVEKCDSTAESRQRLHLHALFKRGCFARIGS